MIERLSEKYLNKMKELLGDEYDDYLNSFNEKRIHSLRVNNAKISNEEFERICPFKIKRIPWIENGYYFDENDRPSKHPYYYAGLYYLQEPSAMTPANVLPIEKGDIVLDACAAPGGKSLELASKLGDSGLLVSNDISVSRAYSLLKNLELGGHKNIYVMAEDISKLSKKFVKSFDKILIDAPCSGEGMLRKDPSIIKEWEDKGNEYYANLQKDIVKSAVSMLKDGGMMVYSTCTFDKSEDEDIVSYILSLDDDLKLERINEYEGFTRGIDMDEAIRLYPHKLQGEGHFVALVKKDTPKTVTVKKKHVSKIDSKEAEEFIKLIKRDFDDGYFEIINNNLYFIPEYDFEKKGLRILRSGLLMGEIKKHSFEPSMALALNLKMDEFKNVINLSVDDKRVISYLKGETISVPEAKDGWVLVCVNGYSLGFGKMQSGIMKNKYAKEWRYK
ncbi:MAG: RsmB/NOP family class I SAM-dependent RNA methyltransferase [Firmicutes bacterium]|nr:RsmB/NOP family class I SAM-dependent RNA methyltransferase [Bacillota bacterium]MDY3091924.1 RsmB/NOP family class I SAM-dependent RNA methyltransferase [Erysipelotrichaceae bacterium]